MGGVYWKEEQVEKLKEAFKKSNGDIEEFKKLIASDKVLNARSWNACDRKARLLGLYKQTFDPRNLFSKMKKEDLEDLSMLVQNPSIHWKDIKADPRFEDLKQRQIRNWAQGNEISIRKNPKAKTRKARVYDDRIKELVHENVLADKGVDEIIKIIKSEFGEAAKDLTKKYLDAKTEEMIWTKQTEDALRKVVGHDLPLEKFSKYHKHIPEKSLKRKAKSLTGKSVIQHPVTFLKGLGRIGDLEGLDEAFEFPKTSAKDPYVVKDCQECSQISIINGANIGLKHKRIMQDNPVRRGLCDADTEGDNVVVISNPFDIDVKKAAGGLRVLRAFASGLNTNLKILDEYYQKRLKEEEGPRIIYETVAERFMNMLSGWEKIARDFKGRALIQLGYKEEEVIANAAAWELGYWTKLKQAQIEAEIKAVTSAIADSPGNKDLSEELEHLTELKARHIQSDITEDLQKYARKVMHFVVRKLEESIPNSKVIGQGTVFIKVGEEVIELNIPGHLRVTDNHLASYNKSFGARARMGLVAKTAVICHPYALNFRTTSREINVKNKRAEARVFVAPIMVDGKFLSEALRDSVRSAHPIFRVVRDCQFSPGMLRLRFYNGIVSPESVPLEALTKKPRSSQNSVRPYGGKEFIWIQVITDPHYGSRSREEVYCESTRKSLGVGDAVIQMMRDGGLFAKNKGRVHIYTMNDDIAHGNHFGTHLQPHPRQMSYQAMEQLSQKMKPEEAVRFLLEQQRLKGVDWLEEQIQQVKQRHIKPNMDFFNSILSSVQRSGLLIKGVDKIHGVEFDARSMGAINLGTGNHNEKTTERTRVENLEYRDYIRALLIGEKEWRNKEELVDRLVAAPLEGNRYFAWGIVNAPGGYEWAIEFRSDPPRLSSWMDPLKAAVNNDASRGDYGLYDTGHKTIKIYGDKHFFAAVNTDHTFYHICAAGTSTDLYGHRGFPPNNTGVSFVGLPAGGPETGPILLRTLHVEHIRKYFEKPYDFDWEKFLPNPI